MNEDENIDFPVGILGFSEYHRYVIIEQEGSAFSFLQSVDNKDLCFVIIMPELVCCDYAVELSDDQIELLQIESPEDGKVYGIVTIPENVAEMTVNLQAPVVINTKSLIGAQFVLPGDQYHTQHNVIAEMHKNAYLLQKQSEAVQAQTDRENLQESV